MPQTPTPTTPSPPQPQPFAPQTHRHPSMEKNPSTRRQSTDSSSSPEFEFWMVRNPSFPQPQLLSADQLFDHGVLLPLHHLPKPEPDPDPNPEPDPSTAGPVVVISASKRWKDIFKKGEKNDTEEKEMMKKMKKKDRKSSSSGTTSATGINASDLNINIWLFSRSRSAGNEGRGKPSPAVARKASSAPCSRSNSLGESELRKWPSSPARAGLALGRRGR